MKFEILLLCSMAVLVTAQVRDSILDIDSIKDWKNGKCPSGTTPYTYTKNGFSKDTTCCCENGCCWRKCSKTNPPQNCLPQNSYWYKLSDGNWRARSDSCGSKCKILPDGERLTWNN